MNSILHSSTIKLLLCSTLLLLVVESVQAQMERKRSLDKLPDPELFLSTSLVSAQTVRYKIAITRKISEIAKMPVYEKVTNINRFKIDVKTKID